jgi:hypothetical protein
MEREIFGVDSQMMIWMTKFGVSPGDAFSTILLTASKKDS